MSLFNQTNPTIVPNNETRRTITGELQHLKHKTQLFTILVLLLVCVLSWGVASIFSSQRQSKLPADLTKIAKPINPNLDIKVLDVLEKKRAFTTEELSAFPIYKVIVDPETQTEKVIDINETIKPVATSIPKPKVSATTAPTATATP